MFPLCHPKPQIKNFHLRLRLSLDIKQTPTEHLMMSVSCAVQGQVEEIDCVSTLSIRSSPWGILNGVFLGPWNPPPGWSTLSWCLFRQHVTKGPGWKLPTPVPMRCVLSMTVLGPPPKRTLVCWSRWRTTCFLEAFTEHLLCARHSAKCWMMSLNPRIYSKIQVIIGFPRWQSGKQSTCQFRRRRRPGFHPWVGKTPWSRKCQPTPVFSPGESHGQRRLAGHSPLGLKSQTRLSTTTRAHR